MLASESIFNPFGNVLRVVVSVLECKGFLCVDFIFCIFTMFID